MNQNPEQLARYIIDAALLRCMWVNKNNSTLNLNLKVNSAINGKLSNRAIPGKVSFVAKKTVQNIVGKSGMEGNHLVTQGDQPVNFYSAISIAWNYKMVYKK